MPQATRRVVLSFPHSEVEKPLVYRLVKEFDIVPNILRAAITPNSAGTMILELSGLLKNLEASIDWLKSAGIKVEALSHEIIWNEERCIHCGACTAFCMFGALHHVDDSMRVAFRSEKCAGCEICLSACPTRAMESHF
jgi:Pyruvate/2-oxoacid:ferredoxin oxidoreductase delta subunit